MTHPTEIQEVLARLEVLPERAQEWVWECARVLHFTYERSTSAAFLSALDVIETTETEDCDVCKTKDAIFPADHSLDCPIREGDDPAYLAYCLATGDEVEFHSVVTP